MDENNFASKIKKIYSNINLNEGISILHNFLEIVYLYEGIPAKRLSNMLSLPVPLVSAIKNEFKRADLLRMNNGLYLTDMGRNLVQDYLGYRYIDRDLLKKILNTNINDLSEFENEIKSLEEIYANRPTVDVTIDQSLCTAETGIKRAVLILRCGGLIGKKIACIGDDDLISIAMILVLKRISAGRIDGAASITIFDIDERIIKYVEKSAKELGTEAEYVQHDFRKPLPHKYLNKFDAVFTDPPYTSEGLSLFLSRGISALKTESNLFFYLSFAHKSPLDILAMQGLFFETGLIISDIIKKFNEYNGAQILGGVSDMIILNTTSSTNEKIQEIYDGPMYTNEFNRNTRTYKCAKCGKLYDIGYKEKITTIEQLKGTCCLECGANTFLLIKKNKG